MTSKPPASAPSPWYTTLAGFQQHLHTTPTAPLGGRAPTATTPRLLGLDIGERRIGVALSDRSWTITNPLEVLTRESKARDLHQIQALCQLHDIGGIVVGWPLMLDGTEGAGCAMVRRLLEPLCAALAPLPCCIVDERFSTKAAYKIAHASHPKTRAASQSKHTTQLRERRDALSANVILQGALQGLLYQANCLKPPAS